MIKTNLDNVAETEQNILSPSMRSDNRVTGKPLVELETDSLRSVKMKRKITMLINTGNSPHLSLKPYFYKDFIKKIRMKNTAKEEKPKNKKNTHKEKSKTKEKIIEKPNEKLPSGIDLKKYKETLKQIEEERRKREAEILDLMEKQLNIRKKCVEKKEAARQKRLKKLSKSVEKLRIIKKCLTKDKEIKLPTIKENIGKRISLFQDNEEKGLHLPILSKIRRRNRSGSPKLSKNITPHKIKMDPLTERISKKIYNKMRKRSKGQSPETSFEEFLDKSKQDLSKVGRFRKFNFPVNWESRRLDGMPMAQRNPIFLNEKRIQSFIMLDELKLLNDKIFELRFIMQRGLKAFFLIKPYKIDENKRCFSKNFIG